MLTLVAPVKNFVVDYIERHKHPVNAILHILGVPLAFYGLYKLIVGDSFGIILIVAGYILQWLGHKAQGNEVGEVTLIKNIWRRLSTAKEGKGG